MVKRVARHVIGWFFVALGIVGLFLPVLQGILFLFIGLIILAPDVPFFQKLLCRMEERYPAIFEKAKYLHVDILDWWKRKLMRLKKSGRDPDQSGRRDIE
ncbi:MAG: hypothetical protein HY742_07770 [Deltaproteobacteria bacterium]|nr:hypothetical protein [Deltaproteobacteria bacterium]